MQYTFHNPGARIKRYNFVLTYALINRKLYSIQFQIHFAIQLVAPNSHCSIAHIGPEHQELQVTALADPAQLPVSAPLATNWHSVAKQSDGIVVTHALPDATRVPVA